MNRLKIALLALICVALCIVCSGTASLVLSDPRFGSWHLVQMIGPGSSQLASLMQSSGRYPDRFTLEFTPSAISGRAACNYYSGAYRLDSATQTLFISRLGLTLMACPDLYSNSRDDEYTQLLEAADRYECNWRGLRVYVASKQTVLIFQRHSLSITQVAQQLGKWVSGVGRALGWPKSTPTSAPANTPRIAPGPHNTPAIIQPTRHATRP